MPKASPQPSPSRSVLVVVGFAAAAALAVVLATAGDGTGEPGAPADGGAPRPGAEAGRAAPRSAPVERVRPQRVEPTEQISQADLLAMVPDDAGLLEIRQWEFEMEGGASTPGTDPEGARLEVDEPGWAGRFEAELSRGLRETVLARGVEARRVDCERGRCLVELRYDSMETALNRVDAIRAWLRDQVRCRAYTDGPVTEESPSMSPDQQIWVLCGEPAPREER